MTTDRRSSLRHACPSRRSEKLPGRGSQIIYARSVGYCLAVLVYHGRLMLGQGRAFYFMTRRVV
eukprot:204941-Prorocentrum_minimum.AAC.1